MSFMLCYVSVVWCLSVFEISWFDCIYSVSIPNEFVQIEFTLISQCLLSFTHYIVSKNFNSG